MGAKYRRILSMVERFIKMPPGAAVDAPRKTAAFFRGDLRFANCVSTQLNSQP
jgi:hypothetical protein